MEVLIIDDDSDDCLVMSELLRDLIPDVSCTIIESGEDAIKYLRQPVNVPQIIFLDIHMTGMDGKDTLLKIKGMKSYSRSRVIMYSGQTNDHERLIYQKLGANGFILKTGSREQLKSDIRSAVSG